MIRLIPFHSDMTTRRAARRACVLACALALAATLAVPFAGMAQEEAAESDEDALVIGSWGGAYAESQNIAYFKPFTKRTGIKIRAETYDGSLAAIKSKIADFDVVDLSPMTLDSLCKDGLLETIDNAALEPGPAGAAAETDYLAGALRPCGVASMAWATTIAYDRQAFPKAKPAQIADFLDLKRFPGKRALPNGPRYTLEFALLADGVAPADVYRELGTPEGVNRAFAALDKIKPEILWWNNAQDALTWLAQKKASMGASYSGRIFRAALGARHLEVLWDGQIYDLDLWAIPKQAKHKDEARKFVNFASTPSQMAAQAELIAYGPMRKSAIELVGKHPAVDIDVKAYLPTAPQNFAKALQFDQAWWTQHGAELGKRFQAWREQTAAAADGTQAAPGQAKPPKPPAAEGASP